MKLALGRIGHLLSLVEMGRVERQRCSFTPLCVLRRDWPCESFFSWPQLLVDGSRNVACRF